MRLHVVALLLAACGLVRAADAPAQGTNVLPATGPAVSSKQNPEKSQPPENYEAPRIIIGFEQAGASSANSSQNFFGNFDMTIPTHKNWFRVLLDGRLTTVPQQITATLGDFVAGGALQSLQAVKVNELVRGVEVHGGGQFFHHEIASYQFKEDTDNVFRSYFSFITTGGFSTPFTPLSTLQVYNVPPAGANQLTAFQNQFGVPSGYPYVGLVTKDRDRFFRQYYGGIQITQAREPSDKNSSSFTTGSPLTLDLLYGQDEAITGGRFRGSVFKLDFFAPISHLIPADADTRKKLEPFFFYLTLYTKFARTNITNPYLLVPADSSLATSQATLNQVYVLATDQANRDVYRVGVGIDLLHLASFWK